MEEKEAKRVSLELMKFVQDAYLGTVDSDGFPQMRVMGNLRNKEQCRIAEELFTRHDEDFLIYMLTGHSSGKMQQIRANSKVSVYFCNSAQFHTLLLVGNVEEIDDHNLKKRIWQDEWKIHWPGGPEDPEFIMLKLLPDIMLKLLPEWAKGWHKEGPFEFKLK
ncbi:MAG: pyridoxamine 5'-phosphate oxidase family protein [Planctomycetota bacterium]|jgi:general stress protein 26